MRVPLIPILLLLHVVPAGATPAPVTTFFAPIQPSGLTARVTPFITVPASSAQAPLARINYVGGAHDGTGRLFVNDVNGTLFQAGPNGGTATPWLDIAAQNVGATVGGGIIGPGFAGFAFHPDYAAPGQPGYGKLYTSTNILNTGAPTTLGNGAGPTVIEIREWTASNPLAATFQGTSRVVMRISGYSDAHSSASIAFNTTATPGQPDYGTLYIASGDGHYNDADQNAHSLASPQGKLLRIDPLPGPGGAPYTVPADNPFIGLPDALPEVWASGLRFPQTFTWDRATGAMYINDLGQAAIEEVNLGIKGADYGWSQREGTFATGYAYGLGTEDEYVYPLPPGAALAGYTDPIAQYSHQEGFALGSGVLYRGTKLPALYGKYVLADIVNGRIFTFDPAGVPTGGQATLTELLLTDGSGPADLLDRLGYPNPFSDGNRLDARLAEDADGELLLTLKATGQVYRLEADVPEPATIALLLAGLVLAPSGRLRLRTAAGYRAVAARSGAAARR